MHFLFKENMLDISQLLVKIKYTTNKTQQFFCML